MRYRQKPQAACLPWQVRADAGQRVALALIEAAYGYAAAPSANLSGKPSPTTMAGHVAEDLSGRIEMVLDGGAAVSV